MANELKVLMAKRAELLQEGRSLDLDYEAKSSSIKSKMDEVLESIAECIEADSERKSAPKRRTKPKAKEPDHDAVAKKYADFEPAEGGCLCGCGEDVPEGTHFVRNHDKKLKSIALAVAAGKLGPGKLCRPGNMYAINQGWISGDDLQ